MKIRKSTLQDSLKVPGKIVSQSSREILHRSVRFDGVGNDVYLSATDGTEMVLIQVNAEAEGVADFAMEYHELRALIRASHDTEIEVSGDRIAWPEFDVVPGDATRLELPEDFWTALFRAASIVDRSCERIPLRGIHLSGAGITASNGKEQIHIPLPLSLKSEITIPFPLPLLTAQPDGVGRLYLWGSGRTSFFRIEVGTLAWAGKLPPGHYPDWRQAIPERQLFDGAITFTPAQAAQLLSHLKQIPDRPPFHSVELRLLPDGVSVTPVGIPCMELKAIAAYSGNTPCHSVTLNRNSLRRMLQAGHKTFLTSSDGTLPVLAEGGLGSFAAMPIRYSSPELQKGNTSMETVRQIETVSAPIPPANSLEELNHGIDELRGKLKLLLDESAVLTRKIKEVALEQKQKEREFVQARRAIERIRAASGF